MKDTYAKSIAFVARCDWDIYPGLRAACSSGPGYFPRRTRYIFWPWPNEYNVQMSIVKGIHFMTAVVMPLLRARFSPHHHWC